MKSRRHVLVLWVTMLLLAGCVAAQTSRLEPSMPKATATPFIIAPVTSDPDPLSGTWWELVSIKGKETAVAVPERPRMFLTFNRGTMALHGGCNTVGGHYVLREDRIDIPFSERTEVDCSDRYPGINQVEQAFSYALLTFESYAIEGDQLTIRYEEGEILLRRASKEVSTTPTLEPTPTVRPPATQMPPPLAFSLKTYGGPGFSFQYPANAQVKNVTPGAMPWQAVSPATTEIHVIGPEIRIKPGDADWSYRGPAYRLFVWTYENPEALDAEAWARNYILTSWREAKRLNRPWGGLPISEQGEIDEDKVGSSMIAGQPTFWVDYFGFYSNTIAYYLASSHQVVEVMFSSYSSENLPLAAVQNDVYALILSTFRLEGL